ncbi:hypothetical protein FHS59_001642 [Algoriphagus iocasae]|uniref:Uncharacterized protein n=1 Tax=Algoriphagus iocasae TaxID=1836499 RepID=A0A841MMJ5_9BACT|nr:hypothetical protein [Algoriphagus iocasae]
MSLVTQTLEENLLQINILLLFSLFFCLEAKEPKVQDAAKLQPHKAKRWPAAASAPRAHTYYVLFFRNGIRLRKSYGRIYFGFPSYCLFV